MTEMRIENHPIHGQIENKRIIKFSFDGQQYTAREGETIAAALLAAGVRTLRIHEQNHTPRGIYCNIGHCFECRVEVDGNTVRACLTPVRDGMRVKSVKADIPRKG